MKKAFIYIISICLIILATQVVYADLNNTKQVYNKNDYEDQFTVFEYDNLPTLNIENSFLDYPETISVIKDCYESMLNSVPPEIISVLKENDLDIYCVEDCMDYWPTKKFVVQALGFYGGDYIYITVSFNQEDAIINMENTLYHEIGHAAGHLFGGLDQTKECEEAFQSDLKVSNRYRQDTRMEMFAEVFSLLMHGLSDKSNHMICADVFRDCPNMAAYVCKSYNLPRHYEEYYYWTIRASIYGMLKEYRKAQKMFN